ncbi:MAG: hypothetical protein E6X42_01940 [Streptococcus parasanguinis]|nr:hypothetical protein [Streptococcus parasanguinis]
MENLAMKKFLEIVKDRANEFFNGKDGKVSTPAPLEDERIIDIIQQALRKKQGVHVIFSNKSFTGDIVKYDQERRQLIVKNFKKSMSTIIRISEIQKISLVPNNIRIAQQKGEV